MKNARHMIPICLSIVASPALAQAVDSTSLAPASATFWGYTPYGGCSNGVQTSNAVCVDSAGSPTDTCAGSPPPSLQRSCATVAAPPPPPPVLPPPPPPPPPIVTPPVTPPPSTVNYAVEINADCTVLFPGVVNGCGAGNEDQTTTQQSWPAWSAAVASGLVIADQSDPIAFVGPEADDYSLLCNRAGYQFAIFGTSYPHNVHDNNFWGSSGEYYATLSIDGAGSIVATKQQGTHTEDVISHLFCSNDASASLPPTCGAVPSLGLPDVLVLRSPATFSARNSPPTPGPGEFYGATVTGSDGYEYLCAAGTPEWQQMPFDCPAETTQEVIQQYDDSGNVIGSTTATVSFPGAYAGQTSGDFTCSPPWVLTSSLQPSAPGGNGG